MGKPARVVPPILFTGPSVSVAMRTERSLMEETGCLQ